MKLWIRIFIEFQTGYSKPPHTCSVAPADLPTCRFFFLNTFFIEWKSWSKLRRRWSNYTKIAFCEIQHHNPGTHKKGGPFRPCYTPGISHPFATQHSTHSNVSMHHIQAENYADVKFYPAHLIAVSSSSADRWKVAERKISPASGAILTGTLSAFAVRLMSNKRAWLAALIGSISTR